MGCLFLCHGHPVRGWHTGEKQLNNQIASPVSSSYITAWFWPTISMPVLFIFVIFPQFVSLECLMTSVTDMFPTVFRKGYRRELLLLCLCAVCFFLGLLLVTEVSDTREGDSRHNYIPVQSISQLHVSFGPVGWLVFPSTLWPLRLQWQQPSPSVSVSIHSHWMDIRLVTLSGLFSIFLAESS